MQLTPVESTTLAAVGYDEAWQLLLLEFRSCAIYLYFGVPSSAHQALMEASSKGIHFNRFIRHCYPYSQMPQGDMRQEAMSSGRVDGRL